MTVDVCQASGCVLCGTVTSLDGDWIPLYCPAGTVGDTVRVEHATEYIQICELHIHGTGRLL